MPKKKRPSEKPDEQFERFIETARTLGIDDDQDPLEKAFSILIPKNSGVAQTPPKREKQR